MSVKIIRGIDEVPSTKHRFHEARALLDKPVFVDPSVVKPGKSVKGAFATTAEALRDKPDTWALIQKGRPNYVSRGSFPREYQSHLRVVCRVQEDGTYDVYA